MKILMLAPEPFFQPRGTPISVFFRIKALSDMGHSTDLVTYPLGENVSFPNLRIDRVPNFLGLRRVKIGPSAAKVGLDAALLLKALRRLLGKRYDLIFSHEEAAWIGVVLGRLLRIPHIYDMHSSLPQQLENFDFSRSGILKRTFLALERLVLKNSAAVIVICQDLLDYVRARGLGGKAVLIENFVDFGDFDEGRIEGKAVEQEKSEIAPDGEKIILYTGNFEPYQGLPLLIEAFGRIGTRAVLLIVGGSFSEHDTMRRAAADLGIKGRIVFIEKVPPARVPLYVALADVLVSPRVSGTNTPLKIYSFLKSGKPLVATRLRTHTQVLNDKISILAPAEATGLAGGLALALESEEAQARAREAKRMADREYIYPRYLQKIDEVLKKATARKSGH
jgi:glycosyltransferase involved in cell wall biosynthesis